MDRNQFRQEVQQLYNAGKVSDGAGTKEIADGMCNPVEQLNYIASRAGGKGDVRNRWQTLGDAASIGGKIANRFIRRTDKG